MTMKKLVLTIACCLVVGLSFGQKKAVNAAKNEIKNEKSNIAEARTLIKGAMSDPETKDNAETYYVAGLVENRQFDLEKTKEMLGQKANEEVMYESLAAILPYFVKCDQLDQLPDEKGKIKPKFRKDMKPVMMANHAYYINGGAYYFDKQDYKKAYGFFMDYLEIPKMDMFKGDNLIEKDTLYPQIKYYAAISASQMGAEGRKDAIAMYESLKNDNYKGNEVYQYLCYEYEQLGDTINLVKTLREGAQKFPEESYYEMSLINQYINTGRYDEAIVALNEVIVNKPNDPQLYDVLGRIYENKKDITKAQEYFQRSLSIDPNYSDALGDMGRIYYNKGVDALAVANDIKDNKLYQEALTKAKNLFKEALPYLEKAHQAKPEDREWMNALRSIYYNLDMSEKFEQIEKEMSK